MSTETALTAKQLQDFADIVAQLKQAAPDLEFAFRMIIVAEGERPSEDVLAKWNKLLNDALRVKG